MQDWSAINDPGEKQQRVLAVLRSVPLLWIWDNVEPVAGFPAGTESQWTIAEQRELADFLKLIKLDKQTKAKLLLTSRRDEQQWLGGIPHRVPMPRMRSSDAARLALELGAERKLTRSEINSWQPLLDYCAGNPLTLRVIVGQAVRMGLRGEKQIAAFVQAVRDGEQQIEDADTAQGRDRSLGASLDYGFRHAFNDEELPIVALLHLFQGVVDVHVLQAMGAVGEHALPELAVGQASSLPAEPQAGSLRHIDLKGLLDRCSETGLLTPIDGTWYAIHPALPWFLRQLFAQHYPVETRSVSEGSSAESKSAAAEPLAESKSDSAESLANASGYDGRRRSTATAALRAWVEAVGELSNHYHRQFERGNRDVIQPLALEESNVLHARRVSRRHGWWSPVIGAMQGLRVLYEYQGRLAQWSRLVSDIVPDYCTGADGPVPDREDAYSVVMEYRVRLARNHHRDLPQAARLQEKVVAWDRQQAAAALALPPDAPLDLVGRTSPSVPKADATDSEVRRNDEADTVRRHAHAAQSHYHQALALCPATAITDLGPIHNQLGNLYDDVGQTEQAREHYEKAAQCFEQSGNRFHAGQVRFNIALMYLSTASRESTASGQQTLLRRARTYAAAALRDYQHYEGRAADWEAKAQQLIDHIDQQLT